jgi:hypothetical protein
MQYQNCPFNILFGSTINTLSHFLQFVLRIPITCVPTFKRSQYNVGLEKWLSCLTMWFLFLYGFINMYTILYHVACLTSSWPTPQYISIFFTNFNLALIKHQIFTPYSQGSTFVYYLMGEYFIVYFTIISFTHKLCFALYNYPHNSLHTSTNHLDFAFLL